MHVEYGIGRYHGMVRKSIGGLEREYLEIEYAAGDRLFVPIHQADRVSRYLGADEREPYMHRLGGTEWAAVRDQAEQAVRDIAARPAGALRRARGGPGLCLFRPTPPGSTSWRPPSPTKRPTTSSAPSPRSRPTWSSPKPMDRLICGDVGYGKTEVALRAAFKAVMDGKQVAVLVPTTVLAQQHFYTFRRRLRAFPVTVEMLSRFRTPERAGGDHPGLDAAARWTSSSARTACSPRMSPSRTWGW